MTLKKNKFGLNVAKKIVKCKEREWPELVRDLYRSRQLSKAMHEMNDLQRDPRHRAVADAAIRRIGFH